MYFILSGSSGSGKNTVINELIKKDKNIALLPTFTSREKREYETDGNPFYFFSMEEFQQKIKNNELLEHELIHNNFYGTSRKLLEQFLADGKILIKDIGVQGTFNLAEKLKEVTPVVKVFLTTSGKRELKRRLIGRGEKQIKLRLKRYKYEQKFINKYDYVILNMNLNRTLEIMNAIISLGDDFKKIIPTKNVQKIKLKRIKKICTRYLRGHKIKPIKVIEKDGKIYALNGIERLISSIIVNKTIAKKFVENKKINIISNIEYEQYLKIYK